jgi:hypothetical protein
MAGRRFDVADVAAVLQHWQAGRSERQLSRSFGMGRNRVARIVAAAEAAGLSPGGPALSRDQWLTCVPELFEGRVAVPVSEPERQIAHLHELVLAGLATNTVSTVGQRLRDEQGAPGQHQHLPAVRAQACAGGASRGRHRAPGTNRARRGGRGRPRSEPFKRCASA